MQRSKPYQLVHKYTRFMALAAAFADPVEITMFGLGGASLLRALHHALPDSNFHVVELRQAVVEVATEYFLLPGDHRVSVTVGDAFKQIESMDSNSSDIIFSDIYDAYRMAPEQIQQGFLQECGRVLNDHGYLVINLLGLPTNSSAFFSMLGEIFPTVMLCETAENTVLFASRASPGQAEADALRIERLEARLQQRLTQLVARLQPLKPR